MRISSIQKCIYRRCTVSTATIISHPRSPFRWAVHFQTCNITVIYAVIPWRYPFYKQQIKAEASGYIKFIYISEDFLNEPIILCSKLLIAIKMQQRLPNTWNANLWIIYEHFTRIWSKIGLLLRWNGSPTPPGN